MYTSPQHPQVAGHKTSQLSLRLLLLLGSFDCMAGTQREQHSSSNSTTTS
jgi:hypothetical protein